MIRVPGQPVKHASPSRIRGDMPTVNNQEIAMSNSLGEFHHAEDGPTLVHKIVGAVVILLIVGGIAFYVVDSGMLTSHPATTGKTYPRGL